MRAISNIDQLVDYIKDMVKKVDGATLADKIDRIFKDESDPDSKSIGIATNSAIMEISVPLPFRDLSDVRNIFTTYYLMETNGTYQLVRHTTLKKSLATRWLEEEIKLRNYVLEA